MKARYVFRPDETAGILRGFGEDFYNDLVDKIAIYVRKWDLCDLQFIPSYSSNCVFFCRSASRGETVLKIGRPGAEPRAEYRALCEYDGGRFCRVFDADVERGAILEERVLPGTPLRDEKSLEKRLDVFCSLYSGLHVEPADAGAYPAYEEWVRRISEYMAGRPDRRELYLHMKRAEEICQSVSRRFAKGRLLHGDFHHDNILLGRGGKYVIIDPKGVVGDPVFDVPRFILNEFEDDPNLEAYEKINGILGVFERKLHIPDEVLRQCLYIETVMAECWMVESGSSSGEYPQLLGNAAFAEAILNRKHR